MPVPRPLLRPLVLGAASVALLAAAVPAAAAVPSAGAADSSAVVTVAMTPSPTEVPVGNPLVVRLTVHNSGPDPARQVTTLIGEADNGPAGLSYLAFSAPVARPGDGSATWTLPSLVAGATAALDITVRVERAGTFPLGFDTSFAQGRYRANCPTNPNCLDYVSGGPGTRPGSISDVNADRIDDIVATTPDGLLHFYPGSPRNPHFTGAITIGVGWQIFTEVHAGDITGDGYADLLGAERDGTLLLYANTRAIGPYSSGTAVGVGFQIYRRLLLADVNGDGYADLVGLRPDGTLWYYPNLLPTGAAKPFATAIQIGVGFEDFSQLVGGDLNGDGYGDLIGIRSDGTLWAYTHSPFPLVLYTTGQRIGSGFGVFTQIQAGDLSGDGYADLLATSSDGTLWYYPDNSSTNPGHLPFTTGTAIGSGWQTYRIAN